MLLLPVLLAGCTQPAASPGAAPPPAASLSLLPPTLLLDRAPNDTLEAVVHGKAGNVRYDRINVSVDGKLVLQRTMVYALDEALPAAQANLTVRVEEGDAAYNWSARVALNLTAHPPLLDVVPWENGAWGAERNATLPFEKLLVREAKP
jgi:hypothetical protein